MNESINHRNLAISQIQYHKKFRPTLSFLAPLIQHSNPLSVSYKILPPSSHTNPKQHSEKVTPTNSANSRVSVAASHPLYHCTLTAPANQPPITSQLRASPPFTIERASIDRSPGGVVSPAGRLRDVPCGRCGAARRRRRRGGRRSGVAHGAPPDAGRPGIDWVVAGRGAFVVGVVARPPQSAKRGWRNRQAPSRGATATVVCGRAVVQPVAAIPIHRKDGHDDRHGRPPAKSRPRVLPPAREEQAAVQRATGPTTVRAQAVAGILRAHL